MSTSWAVARAATAVHEAGHAVARLTYQVGFRYVTIRPRTPGYAGLVYDNRPRPVPPQHAAVIALAGPAAEAAHLRELGWDDKHVTDAVAEGTDDDHQAVVAALGDDLPNGYLQHLEETAERLVAANWTQIRAVADSLLRSRRALTYAQIRALVDPITNGDLSCQR